MIDLKQQADLFYQNNPQQTTSRSLIRFLTEHYSRWSGRKRILEVGCGNKSLFESAFLQEEFEVLAIDSSLEAITTAKNNNNDSRIRYLTCAVEELESLDGFDLIVDSHLLHFCIKEDIRQLYLKKVRDMLNDDGLFFGESMVYNKGLEFSAPYYFNSSEYILYKHYEEEWVAQRAIMPVYDLEQNLLQYLKIQYFYIDSSSEFQLEHIVNSHVAAVKFICGKC